MLPNDFLGVAEGKASFLRRSARLFQKFLIGLALEKFTQHRIGQLLGLLAATASQQNQVLPNGFS